MKLALLGAFFTTWSFLKPPSTKQMPSWGALSTEKVSPYLHWKIKHFSRKWFLKNSKYLKYYLLLLSVFHLFMKQHWKIQNRLSPTILLWCTDLCPPPSPHPPPSHTYTHKILERALPAFTTPVGNPILYGISIVWNLRKVWQNSEKFSTWGSILNTFQSIVAFYTIVGRGVLTPLF